MSVNTYSYKNFLTLIKERNIDIDGIIKLSSSNGDEFNIEIKAALISDTISALIGLEGENDIEEWNKEQWSQECVPLPNVKSDVLQLIINYMKFHANNLDENSEEVQQFNKEFVNMDDDTLFNIILAANYLSIKSLLDLTCQTVANYIKACNTPQEIRRRFNIKNDFTPEEEEEVRKENAWCEDR